MKEKMAKLIRVISAPPIMVAALVIILYFNRPDCFSGIWEMIILITTLGIVPMLAYPISSIVPSLKKKGRQAQRKLAFITNLIGYISAFVWALIAKPSRELMIICVVYVLSVVILTIFNKCHVKASGHACSFTGPLILLIYFVSPLYLILGVILSAAIIWASLYLKRHTVKELCLGMLVALLSFAIAVIIL